MKLLLLPLLSSLSFNPVNTAFKANEKSKTENNYHSTDKKKNLDITFQDGAGFKKISCVEFKNQDFCRAELEDFDFDAKFTIVSATVYFSGTNFRNTEKGFITSNSLKSIKDLMNRCKPGTMVVFDEIKVKGPDNFVRTIQGVNFSLF
jgi:GldM C-terminal domain